MQIDTVMFFGLFYHRLLNVIILSFVDGLMLQMKDIWSDVNDDDADDGGSCTLTDDEKLKLEDEQCQQLQQENDFLRAQIAEAITSIIHDAIFIIYLFYRFTITCEIVALC